MFIPSKTLQFKQQQQQQQQQQQHLTQFAPVFAKKQTPVWMIFSKSD